MASQSVDFTVIPEEDLHLSKGSKSIKRVSKGDLYPCQMQKTQNFSCLFRHYAKHNGLDKETLTFTFLEELQGDQLPDMVHLLTGDEIFVRQRYLSAVMVVFYSLRFHRPPRKQISEDPPLDATLPLIKSLDAARNDSDFWDVKFVFVNEENSELGANKCILCNRSAYFCGMFRNSSMLESIQNKVEIFDHKKIIFSAMLEFLYTAQVAALPSFDLEQCTDLLLLSSEYVIDGLKHICQRAMSELINPQNVSKLFSFSEQIGASLLRRQIKQYVEKNISLLHESESFRKELEETPKLSLFVFDAMSESTGHASVKRRRISSSPLAGVGMGTVEQVDSENSFAFPLSIYTGAAETAGPESQHGSDPDNAAGNIVV